MGNTLYGFNEVTETIPFNLTVNNILPTAHGISTTDHRFQSAPVGYEFKLVVFRCQDNQTDLATAGFTLFDD